MIKKMIKTVIVICVIACNILTCNASQDMAKHEEKKGKANVVTTTEVSEVEVYIDDDMEKCIEWMQTDIGQYCINYCNQENVDQYIVVAQIFYESRFCPTLVSYKGAIGLMQVLPEYAGTYMNQVGATNLYNEQDNIRVGIAELKEWGKQSSSTEEMLWLYNGGYPGRYLSISHQYANSVIDLANKIRNVCE